MKMKISSFIVTCILTPCALAAAARQRTTSDNVDRHGDVEQPLKRGPTQGRSLRFLTIYRTKTQLRTIFQTVQLPASTFTAPPVTITITDSGVATQTISDVLNQPITYTTTETFTQSIFPSSLTPSTLTVTQEGSGSIITSYLTTTLVQSIPATFTESAAFITTVTSTERATEVSTVVSTLTLGSLVAPTATTTLTAETVVYTSFVTIATATSTVSIYASSLSGSLSLPEPQTVTE
jgi:hypothetical protein